MDLLESPFPVYFYSAMFLFFYVSSFIYVSDRPVFQGWDLLQAYSPNFLIKFTPGGFKTIGNILEAYFLYIFVQHAIEI